MNNNNSQEETMDSNSDPSIINSLNQEITYTKPASSDTPPTPPRSEPPQILEKDRHINHRNVILVLLSILLFSTIIAALFLTQYFITQFQLKQSQPTPTPSISETPTPTTDPTANWQTYHSDLFNYEIKFPSTWKQIEHSSNFENITSYRSPDDSYVEIIATQVPATQTLEQYLSQTDKINEAGWEGKPSKKILSTSQTQVNNQLAVQRAEEWLAAGFTTSVTYTKIDKYIISFAAIPAGDNKDGEAYKQYSTILSTFKTLTLPVDATISTAITMSPTPAQTQSN